MCLTVCLRRFAVTDALCAVQDPRKMPGQAAQKRAAKAKTEKAEYQQQLQDAVAWCRDNNKGSKAALATGTFPLLRRGALNYALGEAKKKAKDLEKYDEATKNARNLHVKLSP